MEDMVLHEKLVIDVPSNYKAMVDGFNEVYHATELHHVGAEFTKAARGTSFHFTGPNGMMFVPRAEYLDQLAETWDHHAYTHLPLRDLPELGVQQQPRPHPAASSRSPRASIGPSSSAGS